MKRKIKDISFGKTFGDIAIQDALGDKNAATTPGYFFLQAAT